MEKITEGPIEDRLYDVRQIAILGSLSGGRQNERDALDDLEQDRGGVLDLRSGRLRQAAPHVSR